MNINLKLIGKFVILFLFVGLYSCTKDNESHVSNPHFEGKSLKDTLYLSMAMGNNITTFSGENLNPVVKMERSGDLNFSVDAVFNPANFDTLRVVRKTASSIQFEYLGDQFILEDFQTANNAMQCKVLETNDQRELIFNSYDSQGELNNILNLLNVGDEIFPEGEDFWARFLYTAVVLVAGVIAGVCDHQQSKKRPQHV